MCLIGHRRASANGVPQVLDTAVSGRQGATTRRFGLRGAPGTLSGEKRSRFAVLDLVGRWCERAETTLPPGRALAHPETVVG